MALLSIYAQTSAGNIESFIGVAKRAVFEIQKNSHLQPLEWPRVAAFREWPQVAASGLFCRVAASGRY